MSQGYQIADNVTASALGLISLAVASRAHGGADVGWLAGGAGRGRSLVVHCEAVVQPLRQDLVRIADLAAV